MNNSSEVVAAAALQVVVVTICVVILAYVRVACGPRAKFANFLAVGWGIMGMMYLLTAVWPSGASSHMDLKSQADVIWRVIDSTLSFVSSGSLLVGWYGMRYERIKGKEANYGAFVAKLIGAPVGAIAALIALIDKFLQDGRLLVPFSVIDVTVAAAAITMIGIELFRMPLPPDPRQGGIFHNHAARNAFRTLKLSLFIMWGLLQFGYPLSFVNWGPTMFDYPTGFLYNLLAILKLLCAACAGVVIIHASEQWHSPAAVPLAQPAPGGKGVAEATA